MIELPPPITPGVDPSRWPWQSRPDRAELRTGLLPLPKLTVVTPSYNQAAYLEATIRSVLLQGYPHLEFIVLDGGSSDGSREIIERYAEYIHYWHSAPDNGQADAINRGFAMSTGDVMAWLNSDDMYAPGALARVGAQFAASPHAQLMYGEGWYIDVDGQFLHPCHFVRHNITRRYLVNIDPILQPAAFWRRRLWQRVGPLNAELNWVFDWEWFLRAYSLAAFTYLPEFLAFYRVQPEAKTRTGGMARRLEHGRVTRQYGGWWHPNHVMQQIRYVEYLGQRLVERWPRPLAWPVLALVGAPRIAAERVLYGMYMR